MLMWAKYEAFIYSDLSVYNSVFQMFLLADAFCLRKITTNSHILAHVRVVWADDRFPKLKIAISEQILDRHLYMSVTYVILHHMI
jgi:hypothetical protein